MAVKIKLNISKFFGILSKEDSRIIKRNINKNRKKFERDARKRMKRIE